MKKKVIFITIIIVFAGLNYVQLFAQQNVGPLPEGTSGRYIRVAEIGQLADSVNVLGDVTSQGRYIIPAGTNLPELMSFSFGYNTGRGRLISTIGGGKTVVHVKVSRQIANRQRANVALFKYRLDKPEPTKMLDFNLQNNDIVTVEVRRKPSFGDYVRVIAPVISVIATSVLLIKTL